MNMDDFREKWKKDWDRQKTTVVVIVIAGIVLAVTGFVSLAVDDPGSDDFLSSDEQSDVQPPDDQSFDASSTVGVCAIDGASSYAKSSCRRVVRGIRGDTSCVSLQGSFDRAAGNHERESASQRRLPMMKILTLYMNEADDRMREIGCYG